MKKIIMSLIALCFMGTVAQAYTGAKVSNADLFSCEAHPKFLRMVNNTGLGKIVTINSTWTHKWPVFHISGNTSVNYSYNDSAMCSMVKECYNSFSGNEIQVKASCRSNTLSLDIYPLN